MPRLRPRLRSQAGIAMPAVLMMVIAGLAMGGAAVTASIGAQKSSTRDQHAKEALAAADAGMQQAIYRQNKVITSELLPCVVVGLGGDLIAGAPFEDGWCPEISGTVGDASFRYRVKPRTIVGTLGNESEIRVVSIGTSDPVSRRIAENARAKTGSAIFGDADLVGLNDVNLTPASEITGDVGSNGNVSLSNSASLCGDVTYGYGFAFDNTGTWCSGFGSGEGEFNMPPPLQGNVPPSEGGQNSNFRMFSNGDTKTGSATWNSTNRVLTMTGNATATLGGSLPYSFCRIDMQGNSTLIAASGATVRIFFDAPENCPEAACPSSYKQLDVRGNAKIVATSGDPKDFAFLFVGSSTCPTNTVMSGNSQSVNEVILYGPRTDMALDGSSTLSGAMTGQTVTTGGNATFIADPEISDFDVEIALQYQRDRYVECIGGSTAVPPDANC